MQPTGKILFENVYGIEYYTNTRVTDRVFDKEN